MTKICFILPFFAPVTLRTLFKKKKFPAYFDYYLGTFAKNALMHLKVFTNIPFEKYLGMYPNISFYKMDLWGISRLIHRKLKIRPRISAPIKLCDFKPAYGVIFEDFLKGSDYWGYCDADMIIGNLGHFFNDANLEGCDVASASQGNPGYMTIYRNSEKANHLFEKSPDYKRVFESGNNFRFDERGSGGVVAMRQVIDAEIGKGTIRKNNIFNLTHNDCGGMNANRPWKYSCKDGILRDELQGTEVGSFHFVQSKRNTNFVIEKYSEGAGLEITASGIKVTE